MTTVPEPSEAPSHEPVESNPTVQHNEDVKGSIESSRSGGYEDQRSHKRHKSLDLSTITNPPTITFGSTEESSQTHHEDSSRLDSIETDPSSIHSTLRSGSAKVADLPRDTTNDQAKRENEPARERETIPVKLNRDRISIEDLLGVSLDKWSQSEQILNATIGLRTEIERTKREQIRLDTVNQTIELLKFAVDSQIPPNLIPGIFASGEIRDRLETARELKYPEKSKTSTSVFKVQVPHQQPQKFEFHHWQKPDNSEIRSETGSSAGATANSSQSGSQVPTTPSRSEDRKRKASDEGEPKLNARLNTTGHRRNQSEASVSQLRSVYESNTRHQNQQLLRSPYVYPPRDRPILPAHQPHSPQGYRQYQFPPQQQQRPPAGPISPIAPRGHPQQQQQQQHHPHPHPQSFTQGHGPPMFRFPAQQSSPHQLPSPRQPQPIHPQQPQITIHPPQSNDSSHLSSPASATRAQGKSDVSFLITTPNNPPKR